MAISTPSISSSYQRRDFGNPVIQAVLLLIVFVLFSWFILKPKYSQWNQRRTALKTAQDQLAKIESDQQDLNNLVDQLHSDSDDVQKVDEALPLSGRISKAYVVLNSLVQSSGMTLALISSDDSQSTVSAGDKAALANPYAVNRQLHTITLSTSVTGTMEQFKNLLQLIETNGRVLDVDSVEIIGGDTQTKFNMTVKAYAFEEVAK